MKHVTIKDIAEAANVSITTVSFVLNGKVDNISQETIDTVMKVCKDFHYEKNYFASSLKSKVTKTIGLILPEISDAYYSSIAATMDKVLEERGYTLLIANSENSFERELGLYKHMEARQVDYLIILPASVSLRKENRNKLKDALEEISVKYAILDRETNFGNHIEVVNDDMLGGSLATDYLIKKGYKRIACITGPKDVSSSDNRLKGYMESLKKSGLPIDESLIYVGDYKFNTAREIAKKIVQRNDVDAVFAFNDVSAYALYDIYAENDKKIGRDISIVGFDDNSFSSLISPALTTVRQDIKKICETAVDELLKSDSKNGVITISPTLVERKSVCVK